MVQEGSCLTDTGAFRFLVGRMANAERTHVEHHLDACEVCVLLVAEASRESAPEAPNSVASLRPCILQPGMVLGGRYDVRRLLGRGTMGEVYEVEDRLLARTIALKTLNVALADSAQALARLKREVATAVRVTHPNVCRVFDLGFDRADKEGPAIRFLTMEHLKGTTLARFLQVQGPLPPNEAVPILRQLADGLAAAHAAGIVHRDLKAENVMLVPVPGGRPRAVITDFGLADSVRPGSTPQGSPNAFSGTPAYAAPERLAGGRATPASDVYAFGLLALELLTGRLSGSSDAPPVLLSPSSERVSVLPSSLRRFISRATAPNASERFSSGEALSAALRDVSEEGHRPRHRRRTLRIFGAAAIVAIAVAGAVAGRRGDRGGTPAHSSAVPSAGTPAGIEFMDLDRLSSPPISEGRIAATLPPPSRTSRRRTSRDQSDTVRAAPIPRKGGGPSDLIRDLQLPQRDPLPSRRSSVDLVDPFASRLGDASR